MPNTLPSQSTSDRWSLKEQLSLSTAVLSAGQQNWGTVSLVMKQSGEVARPRDWFSQKNCATQYQHLIDKFRKQTNKTEKCGESLVKKLTRERIEELKVLIEKEQQEIMRLEEESDLLNSNDCTEDKLKEILMAVEEEEQEEERREADLVSWIKEREELKQEPGSDYDECESAFSQINHLNEHKRTAHDNDIINGKETC